jgi:hypothetical protein
MLPSGSSPARIKIALWEKGGVPPLISLTGDHYLMQDENTTGMLKDLVWLNAVIATELIQITENSSAILRNAPPPASCLAEHHALRETALAMAEKYRPGTMLAQHLNKHQ